MLVLLSFALVLVATVLLVLGLLNDNGLPLIYISIACSAAAAVVLIVAVRLAKPKEATLGAQLEPMHETPSEPLPVPEEVPLGVGASKARAVPAPAGAPASVPTATAVAPGDPAPALPADGEWSATDQDDWAADDEEWGELEFPIADYDDLTSAQILPLLPQLYADEIDVVEERERATKARTEILDRLAELRSGHESSGLLEPAGSNGPSGSPVGDPLADHVDVPGPLLSQDSSGQSEDFPIPDYDELTVARIRPLLRNLDDAQLAAVRERELAGAARATIVDDIDRRLGPQAVVPAPPKATKTARKKTGSTKALPRRAAPRKAAVNKAGAGGRTVAKTAASPGRAAARKAAPAGRAAARKAAPAGRAAAKKAAATARTVTRKAPERKAATTGRAVTKKAAASKVAATGRAAPKRAVAKKAARRSR